MSEEDRAIIVRYFTVPDASLEEMADRLDHAARCMWDHAKSQTPEARKWCLRVATKFPVYAGVIREHLAQV